MSIQITELVELYIGDFKRARETEELNSIGEGQRNLLLNIYAVK